VLSCTAKPQLDQLLLPNEFGLNGHHHQQQQLPQQYMLPADAVELQQMTWQRQQQQFELLQSHSHTDQELLSGQLLHHHQQQQQKQQMLLPLLAPRPTQGRPALLDVSDAGVSEGPLPRRSECIRMCTPPHSPQALEQHKL
jgi:hypothetical protein